VKVSSRLLVVISTPNKEKAMTGLMFARTVLQSGRVDDVKVVFLGATCERMLAQDEEMASVALELAPEGHVIACKAISDREGISGKFEEMGVRVEYVGSIITDAIKDGYAPMVF